MKRVSIFIGLKFIEILGISALYWLVLKISQWFVPIVVNDSGNITSSTWGMKYIWTPFAGVVFVALGLLALCLVCVVLGYWISINWIAARKIEEDLKKD